MQYFSDEYFKELEKRLTEDAKWQQDTKGIKTSIQLSATDRNETFTIRVDDGKTTVAKPDGGPVEFLFDGTYETWTRVAKGEVDLQSAVLKGILRFRGSITKILYYKDRFVRVAEILRSIPVEY